jgi:RNA polymerase sigma-70 factor (ECF subfamily)
VRPTWVPGSPEPLIDDAEADPSEDCRARRLHLAGVLVVLERLTRVERAALLLREAFDYGYTEIAEM